jgi:hypothetical protein
LEGLSPWAIAPGYGNAGLLAWRLPAGWSSAVLYCHGTELLNLTPH